MRKSILTALAASLALMGAAPAASAATKKERQQAAQIKAQAKTIKALKRERVALKAELLATRTATQQLRGAVAALSSQAAAVAAENAGLRGTLSEGVAAVAAGGSFDALVRVILEPAQNAWACSGEKSVNEWYVRFTFNGRLDDGRCF